MRRRNSRDPAARPLGELLHLPLLCQVCWCVLDLSPRDRSGSTRTAEAEIPRDEWGGDDASKYDDSKYDDSKYDDSKYDDSR